MNLLYQNLSQNKKRWFYIILGVFINICLGTVYSWSVFRKPIEETLLINATQSGLPYMFFLFFYAITMPVAGKYIDKNNPRWIAIFGGLLVALGWFLAGFTSNIYSLTLTYGIIAGVGVGIVYGVPISVAARWFPAKKGLVVGLTLLGFGLSPFITAPLARYLISQVGVLNTFKYLGFSFSIIITILSLPLKNPMKKKKKQNLTNQNFSEKENTKNIGILSSCKFYSLWFCYLIGTFSGLMAIGVTSPVAEEIIKLPEGTAAYTLSLFAVFNGIGRPLYGWITDNLSARFSAMISYSLIIIASILILQAEDGSIILYIISFSLLWLNLGGWLAIAPAATGSIFGVKNYSRNYGLIFTAYGVGAIIGTIFSGRIRDITGNYQYSFYPLIFLALIGIIISWLFFEGKKAI